MAAAGAIAAQVGIELASAVGESLAKRVLGEPLALAASQLTEAMLESFWASVDSADLIYVVLVDIKRELWEDSPYAGGKTAGYLGPLMAGANFPPLAVAYVKYGLYKVFDGKKGMETYAKQIDSLSGSILTSEAPDRPNKVSTRVGDVAYTYDASTGVVEDAAPVDPVTETMGKKVYGQAAKALVAAELDKMIAAARPVAAPRQSVLAFVAVAAIVLWSLSNG